MTTMAIDPRRFYNSPDEKNKLNWFCYALAESIRAQIDLGLGKKLAKHGFDAAAVVAFAVDYAQHMKTVMQKRMSMPVDSGELPQELIAQHFAGLDAKLVHRLAECLAAGWDAQIDRCVSCSQQCIKDWRSACALFDETGAQCPAAAQNGGGSGRSAGAPARR